jgi:hypothetical protein
VFLQELCDECFEQLQQQRLESDDSTNEELERFRDLKRKAAREKGRTKKRNNLQFGKLENRLESNQFSTQSKQHKFDKQRIKSIEAINIIKKKSINTTTNKHSDQTQSSTQPSNQTQIQINTTMKSNSNHTNRADLGHSSRRRMRDGHAHESVANRAVQMISGRVGKTVQQNRK